MPRVCASISPGECTLGALGEILPHEDIATLRGIEGARVKEMYKLLAQRFGISGMAGVMIAPTRTPLTCPIRP